MRIIDAFQALARDVTVFTSIDSRVLPSCARSRIFDHCTAVDPYKSPLSLTQCRYSLKPRTSFRP